MNSIEKRERLAFYPYSHEMDIIYNFRDELKDYDIRSVISYQNSKIDICERANSIFFTEDGEAALERADCLVLCDNIKKFGKKGYLRQLEYAKKLNKKVYVSCYLYDWLGAEVLRDLQIEILNDMDTSSTIDSGLLKTIDIPVVSILGEGENSDKFGVLLSINKYLKKEGYCVLTISGNSLAKLFGCEVLPAFMYSKQVSIVEKILRLNYYIYNITKRYEPDIILISCPGGFMPLNEYEQNYFGEIAYVVSHALTVDLGIVCTYFRGKYGSEYLEEVKKLCKIRLGTDVTACFMSRQSYKTEAEFKRIFYRFYSEEFCEKEISEDFKDYYLFDYIKSGKGLVKIILDSFHQNIEVI